MFWVYLCDWSLVQGGVEILDSKCEDDQLYKSSLAKLVGSSLNNVSGLDENETCKLTFSNSLELFLDDAADIYGQQRDMMMIFRGDSPFLVFRSGIGLVRASEE